MRKKMLAIIGNGMATCRLLDELVERKATQRFEVAVFGLIALNMWFFGVGVAWAALL